MKMSLGERDDPDQESGQRQLSPESIRSAISLGLVPAAHARPSDRPTDGWLEDSADRLVSDPVAGSPSEVEEMLRQILKELLVARDFTAASVYLVSTSGRMPVLHRVAHRGIPGDVERLFRSVPLTPRGCANLTNAGPVIAADILADRRVPHAATLAHAGFRALGWVPLVRRGDLLGVLAVARTEPGTITESDLAALRALAVPVVLCLSGGASSGDGRLAATNQEIQQLRKSTRLQRRLLRVLLENRGLGSIANAVAEEIATPIWVENIFHRLVASSHLAAGDGECFGATTRGFQLDTERAADCHRDRGTGLYPGRDSERSGSACAGFPMVQKQTPTVEVCPVVGEGRLLGYLYAERSSVGRVGGRAAELRVVVDYLAVAMLRDRQVREAGVSAGAALLADLVADDEHDPADLLERAAYLGHDLGAPYRLSVVQLSLAEKSGSDNWMPLSPSASSPLPPCVPEPIDDATRAEVLRAIESRLPRCLIVPRGRRLVILAPLAEGCDDASPAGGLAAGVRDEAARFGALALVAEGPVCRGLADYARAYTGTIQLLDIATALRKWQGTVREESLGLFGLLGSGRDSPERLRRFIERTIGKLRTYDADHDSDLVHTLEVYLRCGGSLAAAKVLIVHPNTLKYRLHRIAEIGGIDVHDSAQRFEVELALRLQSILP